MANFEVNGKYNMRGDAGVDHSITDAMSLLSTSRYLEDLVPD
jgi:hypothetical protein